MAEENIVKTVEVQLTGSLRLFVNSLKDAQTESEKAVQNIKKGFKGLVEEIGKFQTHTSDAFRSLRNMAIGLGVIVSGVKIVNWLREVMEYAGRVEVLQVVVRNMGRISGYTAGQVDAMVAAVERMNITTKQAALSVTKFLMAGLNLNKVAQLARVAQDAAVIMGFSSQEALEGIVHGIITMQPRILRTYGIITNLNLAYRRYAAAHRISFEEMEQETKQEVALNEVIRIGARLQGTYQTAMEKAQKLMLSLQRVYEQFKLTVGKELQIAFMTAIRGMMDFLNAARQSGELKDNFSAIGNVATRLFSLLKNAAMFLLKYQGVVAEVFKYAVIYKFASALSFLVIGIAKTIVSLKAAALGMGALKVTVFGVIGLLTGLGMLFANQLPKSIQIAIGVLGGLALIIGVVKIALDGAALAAARFWTTLTIGGAAAIIISAVSLLTASFKKLTSETDNTTQQMRTLGVEADTQGKELAGVKEHAIELMYAYQNMYTESMKTEAGQKELQQTLKDLSESLPQYFTGVETLKEGYDKMGKAIKETTEYLKAYYKTQWMLEQPALIKNLEGTAKALDLVAREGKLISNVFAGTVAPIERTKGQVSGLESNFVALTNLTIDQIASFAEFINKSERIASIFSTNSEALGLWNTLLAESKELASAAADRDYAKVSKVFQQLNVDQMRMAELIDQHIRYIELQSQTEDAASKELMKREKAKWGQLAEVMRIYGSINREVIRNTEALKANQDQIDRGWEFESKARDKVESLQEINDREEALNRIREKALALEKKIAEANDIKSDEVKAALELEANEYKNLASAAEKYGLTADEAFVRLTLRLKEYDPALTAKATKDAVLEEYKAQEDIQKSRQRTGEISRAELIAFYQEWIDKLSKIKTAVGTAYKDIEKEIRDATNVIREENAAQEQDELAKARKFSIINTRYMARYISLLKERAAALWDAGKFETEEYRNTLDALAGAEKQFLEMSQREWLKSQQWKVHSFKLLTHTYDTFLDTLSDLEMTGKKRRERIWQDFLRTITRMIGDFLMQEVIGKFLKLILGIPLSLFPGGGALVPGLMGEGEGGLLGIVPPASIPRGGWLPETGVGSLMSVSKSLEKFRQAMAVNIGPIDVVLQPAAIVDNRGLHLATVRGQQQKRIVSF